MDNKQPQKPDFSILKQLGLSETAIASYEKIYFDGFQTAGELTASINKSRTSIYSALDQLEKKGFVRREKNEMMHRVTKFWAIRLDKALENLAIYQRRAVQELVDYQVEESIQRQVVIGAQVINRDWR